MNFWLRAFTSKLERFILESMKYLLFVLTILMIGCSGSSSGGPGVDIEFVAADYPVHEDTDEELIPYVKRFAYESARLGRPVPVNAYPLKVVPLPLVRKGTCFYERKIEINKAHLWDNMSAEMIVFHELGHCVLGKDHDDEEVFTVRLDKNGVEEGTSYKVPVSLMNTYGVDDWVYEKNFSAYLRELFLNQKAQVLKYPYDFKVKKEWSNEFYNKHFPGHKLKFG